VSIYYLAWVDYGHPAVQASSPEAALPLLRVEVERLRVRCRAEGDDWATIPPYVAPEDVQESAAPESYYTWQTADHGEYSYLDGMLSTVPAGCSLLADPLGRPQVAGILLDGEGREQEAMATHLVMA
jgi:hypothetical protein